MEPPPQTYVPNQQVLAAELNDLCTRAVGASPAGFTGSYNNLFRTPTLTPNGITEVFWIPAAGSVNTGGFDPVDSLIDWRDRVIVVNYVAIGAANRAFGSADDYLFDANMSVPRVAYLGTGGRTAALAAPSAGNPPVPAVGASWAMEILTDVWIYAAPSGARVGELQIYNNSGVDLALPLLFIRATAKTGYRP